MFNRTVRVYGQGYGETPASITATLNGVVVFDGEIPTTNQPITDLIVDPAILFTFEVPLPTDGTIPQTITVNTGTVIFAGISANYNQLPTILPGPDVYAAISWRANYTAEPRTILGVDPRSNPTIDGIPQTSPVDTEEGSTVWWTIPQDSVFEYDLVVAPGYAPS
jgi:hypothetical protein